MEAAVRPQAPMALLVLALATAPQVAGRLEAAASAGPRLEATEHLVEAMEGTVAVPLEAALDLLPQVTERPVQELVDSGEPHPVVTEHLEAALEATVEEPLRGVTEHQEVEPDRPQDLTEHPVEEMEDPEVEHLPAHMEHPEVEHQGGPTALEVAVVVHPTNICLQAKAVA